MPLIAYACECNHSEKKFFRQVKDIPATVACPKCEKQMKKLLSSPSSSSKISIDNGIQARAVEITPDIIEINKARSEKNYRED
jgi:putative FmdB family regulatory protein